MKIKKIVARISLNVIFQVSLLCGHLLCNFLKQLSAIKELATRSDEWIRMAIAGKSVNEFSGLSWIRSQDKIPYNCEGNLFLMFFKLKLFGNKNKNKNCKRFFTYSNINIITLFEKCLNLFISASPLATEAINLK